MNTCRHVRTVRMRVRGRARACVCVCVRAACLPAYVHVCARVYMDSSTVTLEFFYLSFFLLHIQSTDCCMLVYRLYVLFIKLYLVIVN